MPDLPMPMERAVDLAAKLTESALPGDRTALVLAGAPPRLLAPLSADTSLQTTHLKTTKASLADTNLSASLPLVRSLLAQGENDVELVFLTENLKTHWQQKDVQTFLKDLPRSAQVKVVEVGAGSPTNAWISQARLYQFGPDDDRWLRVEAGCVGQAHERSVRLSGVAGVADDVQAITLKPGQIARASFKIPAGVPLQGQVAQLRLEPSDALPSDDEIFLNLDTAWALRVLLVEPEELSADERSVGIFLKTGMQALSSTNKQTLEISRRTAVALTPAEVRKADVVLLAGVPELNDVALESLETRVRGGAGLAIFLGPQLKPAFYNQKLHRPQQPTEGLLPLALKTGADGPFTEGKSGMLTNLRWTHPLFASLHDPVLSDLTQARFRTYGSLDGTLGKNDTVLAQYDDAMPAIIERPLGAGRVLFFNTTANDAWSDLPRRKSFLPLLDHMLSYLSAGGLRRSFTVGDTATVPLPDVQPGSDVIVRTPTGARLTPRLLTLRGQTLLHLEALTEAGAYRVEAGGKNSALVVNAGRGDSPLSPMDASTLESWWAPVPIEILSADAFGQRLDQQAHHWPLWPMLVVLAGLLLIAETIYVHRLCPRANPKAVDAVVPQRGVLRPVGEKSV
jgi:hypothetical protein